MVKFQVRKQTNENFVDSAIMCSQGSSVTCNENKGACPNSLGLL